MICRAPSTERPRVRAFCGFQGTGPRHRPRHNRKTQGSLDNNDHSARPVATPTEARGWTQILSRYRQPSDGRGIVEIAITLVPLVVLWVLDWVALDVRAIGFRS